MLNKRFFISWLVSSIVMFVLSYVWHGILVIDFNIFFNNIPFSVFLTFAAFSYLGLGAFVAKVFTIEYFTKYTRHLFLRGLIVGAVCGFVIFVLTLVTG